MDLHSGMVESKVLRAELPFFGCLRLLATAPWKLCASLNPTTAHRVVPAKVKKMKETAAQCLQAGRHPYGWFMSPRMPVHTRSFTYMSTKHQ